MSINCIYTNRLNRGYFLVIKVLEREFCILSPAY